MMKNSCNIFNIDGNPLIASIITTKRLNANDIKYSYHIDITDCKNDECIQSLSLENIIEINNAKIEFIIKHCKKTSKFILITNIGIIYIFCRDLNLSIIPYWKFDYSFDIFNNNRYDGYKNNLLDMDKIEYYSFNYPFISFHELNRNNSIEIFNIATNLITSIAPSLLSDKIMSCQISNCSNYIAIINESIDDIKNYNENNEEIKRNNNTIQTSLYILDTEQLVMYHENNASSYDNELSNSINDYDENVDIVEKLLEIHLILDFDIITNIKLKASKQSIANINSFSINWKDDNYDLMKSLLLTCDSFGGKIQVWSISKGITRHDVHKIKDLIRNNVNKDDILKISTPISSSIPIDKENRSGSLISSEIAVAAIKQVGVVDYNRKQSLGNGTFFTPTGGVTHIFEFPIGQSPPSDISTPSLDTPIDIAIGSLAPIISPSQRSHIRINITNTIDTSLKPSIELVCEYSTKNNSGHSNEMKNNSMPISVCNWINHSIITPMDMISYQSYHKSFLDDIKEENQEKIIKLVNDDFEKIGPTGLWIAIYNKTDLQSQESSTKDAILSLSDEDYQYYSMSFICIQKNLSNTNKVYPVSIFDLGHRSVINVKKNTSKKCSSLWNFYISGKFATNGRGFPLVIDRVFRSQHAQFEYNSYYFITNTFPYNHLPPYISNNLQSNQSCDLYKIFDVQNKSTLINENVKLFEKEEMVLKTFIFNELNESYDIMSSLIPSRHDEYLSSSCNEDISNASTCKYKLELRQSSINNEKELSYSYSIVVFEEIKILCNSYLKSTSLDISESGLQDNELIYSIDVAIDLENGLGLRLDTLDDYIVIKSFKSHPITNKPLFIEALGCVAVGDSIVSVNGYSLYKLSLSNAIQAIRNVIQSTDKKTIVLTLQRNKPHLYRQSHENILIPDVNSDHNTSTNTKIASAQENVSNSLLYNKNRVIPNSYIKSEWKIIDKIQLSNDIINAKVYIFPSPANSVAHKFNKQILLLTTKLSSIQSLTSLLSTMDCELYQVQVKLTNNNNVVNKELKLNHLINLLDQQGSKDSDLKIWCQSVKKDIFHNNQYQFILSISNNLKEQNNSDVLMTIIEIKMYNNNNNNELLITTKEKENTNTIITRIPFIVPESVSIAKNNDSSMQHVINITNERLEGVKTLNRKVNENYGINWELKSIFKQGYPYLIFEALIDSVNYISIIHFGSIFNTFINNDHKLVINFPLYVSDIKYIRLSSFINEISWIDLITMKILLKNEFTKQNNLNQWVKESFICYRLNNQMEWKKYDLPLITSSDSYNSDISYEKMLQLENLSLTSENNCYKMRFFSFYLLQLNSPLSISSKWNAYSIFMVIFDSLCKNRNINISLNENNYNFEPFIDDICQRYNKVFNKSVESPLNSQEFNLLNQSLKNNIDINTPSSLSIFNYISVNSFLNLSNFSTIADKSVTFNINMLLKSSNLDDHAIKAFLLCYNISNLLSTSNMNINSSNFSNIKSSDKKDVTLKRFGGVITSNCLLSENQEELFEIFMNISQCKIATIDRNKPLYLEDYPELLSRFNMKYSCIEYLQSLLKFEVPLLSDYDSLSLLDFTQIALWKHDMKTVVKFIEISSLRKFSSKKDAMDIFLEMSIIGKIDVLYNFAKIDKSTSGKQLLSLLTLINDDIDDDCNHSCSSTINTHLSSESLRNSLRKNAFALMKLKRYKHAAATFLCANPPFVKEACSILSQQLNNSHLSLLVSRLVECRLESTSSKGMLLGTISRDILKSSLYPSLSKGINCLSNGKSISEFNIQLQTNVNKERNLTKENITTISIDDVVELMIISMWLQDKQLLLSSLSYFVSASFKTSSIINNDTDTMKDNFYLLYSDLNFISSLKWILLHTSYILNNNDDSINNILKVQILHKINHFLSIHHLNDELVDLTNIFQNCNSFNNQYSENSTYFITFNRFCIFQLEKYKINMNIKKENKIKAKEVKEMKKQARENNNNNKIRTNKSSGFNFSNSNKIKTTSSSSSSEPVNSALDMFDMTPSNSIKPTTSSNFGFNFSNSNKIKTTSSSEPVNSALDMF